jgi:hypothetical protein
MNLAVVYCTSEALPGKQLVCVDTDSPEAEAWVREQRPLPPTPTAETAKGYHRYFMAPDGLQHVSPRAGLPEVRAGAHYSILPPSVHPTGVLYAWVDALTPWEVSVADLPTWGVALMQARERREAGTGVAEMGPVETVPEGRRNETLFRKCAQWRANDVPDAQLRTAAHAWNRERCVPPLPDREVDATVDSVLKFAPGTSRQQEALRRGETTPQAQPPRDTPEAPEEAADAQERAANEESLLASAEAAVNAVRTHTSPVAFKGAVPIADLAAEIIENVETRRLLPRRIYGMRSGWPSVDWFFGGFAWQGLMLLSADSGAGKTTIARHIIYATAEAVQDPLLVYMLEGEKESFMRYYAGWKYGVPAQHMRPGSDELMTDDDRELLVRAYSEFATLPVLLCDRMREAGQILFDIERRAQEGPIAGVILDNVNLLQHPKGNKYDHATEAAMRALDLADIYKFPFLALSQVNVQGNDWKERGGPEWRNNATCVFYAERGERGCRKEERAQSNLTNLLNLKARHEEGCLPPMRLLGDKATGRLWEEEDYERLRCAGALGGVRVHDND